LLTAARADPLLRARLDVAAGADIGDAYDDRVLRQRPGTSDRDQRLCGLGGAYSYFIRSARLWTPWRRPPPRQPGTQQRIGAGGGQQFRRPARPGPVRAGIPATARP